MLALGDFISGSEGIIDTVIIEVVDMGNGGMTAENIMGTDRTIKARDTFLIDMIEAIAIKDIFEPTSTSEAMIEAFAIKDIFEPTSTSEAMIEAFAIKDIFEPTSTSEAMIEAFAIIEADGRSRA